MSRFNEVVKKAREGYQGISEERAESYAVGFLAQWVCQLEQELALTKEDKESEVA